MTRLALQSNSPRGQIDTNLQPQRRILSAILGRFYRFCSRLYRRSFRYTLQTQHNYTQAQRLLTIFQQSGFQAATLALQQAKIDIPIQVKEEYSEQNLSQAQIDRISKERYSTIINTAKMLCTKKKDWAAGAFFLFVQRQDQLAIGTDGRYIRAAQVELVMESAMTLLTYTTNNTPTPIITQEAFNEILAPFIAQGGKVKLAALRGSLYGAPEYSQQRKIFQLYIDTVRSNTLRENTAAAIASDMSALGGDNTLNQILLPPGLLGEIDSFRKEHPVDITDSSMAPAGM